MQIKLIIIVIVLFFCQSAFAKTNEDYGLLLRGTAYKFYQKTNDDHVEYGISLRMEFVNEGKKPVILIKPMFASYGWFQHKVTFYENNWKTNNEDRFISKFLPRKNVRDEGYKELAKALNSDTPPENYTITIEPGNTIQFDDRFFVRQKLTKIKVLDLITQTKIEKFAWEGFKEGDYCDDRCGLSIRDYSKFKIQYKINLLKYQSDPDLLEKLQRKWSRYGFFPVDDSGGFSIISELIDSNFPG